MRAAQERSEFHGHDAAVADVYKDLAQELGPTAFLGYEGMGTYGKGTVRAILVGGGKAGRADRAAAGQDAAIVCDRTPFYGAAGGQIGDTGTIVGPRGRVRVDDTLKPVGDLIVHLGQVEAGELAAGDAVELTVREDRRDQIRANHSATHLLHLALKKVLGDHAAQKGSLVAPDRLRFDFSHFAPLTEAEQQKIEDLVNAEIRKNRDSETRVLSLDEARRQGAVAMFGEKYGDRVRVVRIGEESLELCAGTHVRRAGDIGLCKIVGEGGIAQGVRRLEAVTGAGALDYLRRLEGELGRAAARLKGAPFEVAARVDKLAAELRARDKELAELRQKLATGAGRDLMADVREVGGVRVLAARTDVTDPRALREVGDQLRDRIGSGIVVLAGADGEKVSIVAVVTKDLTGRYHAGKIAGAVAEVVGGKGGGRPDMAQAGGTDPSKVDQALQKVFEIVGH